MYKLIAFNEVAENFSAHFALGISPYFNRCKSHETGMLHFITATNLCGTYARIAGMNAPNR